MLYKITIVINILHSNLWKSSESIVFEQHHGTLKPAAQLSDRLSNLIGMLLSFSIALPLSILLFPINHESFTQRLIKVEVSVHQGYSR